MTTPEQERAVDALAAAEIEKWNKMADALPPWGHDALAGANRRYAKELRAAVARIIVLQSRMRELEACVRELLPYCKHFDEILGPRESIIRRAKLAAEGK